MPEDKNAKVLKIDRPLSKNDLASVAAGLRAEDRKSTFLRVHQMAGTARKESVDSDNTRRPCLANYGSCGGFTIAGCGWEGGGVEEVHKL